MVVVRFWLPQRMTRAETTHWVELKLVHTHSQPPTTTAASHAS